MKPSIIHTIQQFLTKTFYLNPTRIKPYSRIKEDLKLSQIEFLEMVMVIENQYHIQLADNELNTCYKVNDLATIILGALGGQKQ